MSSGFSMIILLVLMFGVMYFGMMRPQKKQQQQRMEMLKGLKKGDKIVTIGGLHGVIDSIDRAGNTVDLDLDGVFLTFSLSAIRTVTPAAAPVEDKPYSEPSSDDVTSSDAGSDNADSEAASEDTPADSDKQDDSESK